MTVKELKEFINRLDEKKDAYNVVISLSQVSVGIEAYTDIKMIYEGMDWESGQIRIEPSKPIIEKHLNRDICKSKRKDPVFPKRFVCTACGNYVNKDDKYCRSCGQNIKGIEQ